MSPANRSSEPHLLHATEYFEGTHHALNRPCDGQIRPVPFSPLQRLSVSTAHPVRLALALVLASAALAAMAITPVPDKVAPVIADRQDFQVPDRVQLRGWIGTRIAANETNRMVKLDPARLLEGYRQTTGPADLGRRARRQVAARRHAGLGQYRRPGPAREARLHRRRADQVPASGRLPGHLRGERALDAVGCLGAQVQSHRPGHLHALHRQPGTAARLPAHGRPALQHLRRRTGQAGHHPGGATHGHGAHQRARADGACSTG